MGGGRGTHIAKVQFQIDQGAPKARRMKLAHKPIIWEMKICNCQLFDPLKRGSTSDQDGRLFHGEKLELKISIFIVPWYDN